MRAGPPSQRLGDQRQIRRQRAAIGRAGRFLVGEGRREVVGRDAGPRQALAVLVEQLALPCCGTGRALVAGGDGLDLGLGEAGPARIGQRVEGDAVEAVTGRADFLVDLEAALQGRAVIGAEGTFEGEATPVWPEARLPVAASAARRGSRRTAIAATRAIPRRRAMRIPYSPYSAAAGAAASRPSTALAMLSGRGLGVSIRPTIGRISQKKAK